MTINQEPLKVGGGGPDPEAYVKAQRSPQFQELRKRYRGFSFPMTVAFLVWYFAFVLMSVFAPAWMAQPVWGNVNRGIVFGLLQFVSTGLITWLYVRHANKKLDPLATEIREELEGTN
ncbi:MAG: DUF485 domain-containing protein [Candidatus Nanopelagicales bacterium]|jgi:uncharacterized membrane protein (DUF485 family)